MESCRPVTTLFALATIVKEGSILLERLEYFSNWNRARRAVAVCYRYQQRLLASTHDKKSSQMKNANNSLLKYEPVTVEEIRNAEFKIIKKVQREAFSNEIEALESLQLKDGAADREEAKRRNVTMKRTSSLYRLDPFLDKDGILRVGGRIKQASISEEVKHPIILPKEGHVSKLVIRHFHEKTEHQGTGFTLNKIRSSGYWIIGGSSVVSSHIKNCARCRRLRATVQEQKMANLTEDRLEPAPPFTYCSIDYFGPWYIKEGCREMKQYGILFTCMASRAIHLEVSHTIETDSFINAFRRFVSRRGPVRQLRSDQGTNFIGAKRELQQALAEMDQGKIRAELLRHNCDWFDFKFNAPSASHMGGIWERQIRTVRGVLSAILEKNGTQLDDEALSTFMCEAEAIVNSRPLTVNNISSPDSLEALTPNHLLTMKTKVVLPPPGVFQAADQYSRKRWRRVQHLSNEFWTRWRKEFLQSLQEHQKWI